MNTVSRLQHLELRERYNVLTDRERAQLTAIRSDDKLRERLDIELERFVDRQTGAHTA